MSDTSTAQPQRLGKYELVRSIARGGMGQVHLAKLAGELGFEKLLVVKTVRPELASDPRFVELFAAEARTAVGLSHPNIAPIYELGRAEDGTLYTAMGWVDGPSLQALIRAQDQRDAPLALGAVLFIARELLDGLGYAHAGDGARPAIVHRDINPRNVLVDRNGRVQIIDFGIAKPAESEAQSGVGSVGYMAPEQARGEAVDPRADVFSVGCLIYELSTGLRAFTEAGVWMTPTLECVPEPLRPVLERCLALDPSQRYADAEACLRAVAPLLGHHAPGFASRDLAGVVADLFPDGWTQDPVAAGPDDATPVTAAPLETFATRLPDLPEPPAVSAPQLLVESPPSTSAPDESSSRARLLVLGLLAVALVLVLAFVFGQSPRSTSSSTAPDPSTTRASEGHDETTSGEPDATLVPTRDLPSDATSPTAPTITLIVEPADASVELEGVALEGRSPFSITLEPGGAVRKIELHRAGHHSQTLELDPAAPPEGEQLEVTLEPLADGELSVLAPAVAWAEVWLDGERIGTTPLTKHSVIEGRHQLEVRCTVAVCDRAQTLLDRSIKVRPAKPTKIVVP